MENNTENGNGGKNRSTKIFVRQLPSDVDWAEIEKLAADFGDVLSCNHGGTAEAPSAIIAYKTSEQATEAAEKLDKKEINGVTIKATIYVERIRNARRTNASGGGMITAAGGYPNAFGVATMDYLPQRNSSMNSSGNPVAAAGLPLRMVVGARYVGAIIGQGGANIREITRESKARCVVDVNRGVRDQTGNVEKVINVYGPPDSCSKACSKILEVVQRETAKDPANEGKVIEPELKLRAHNNLVGRLIGKNGSTIKKIMEETGCTIFVSNISELTPFNMERTITIRGSLENVSMAELKISSKLRQCWETDVANAAASPSAVYGGMHPHHHPFVSIPQMGGVGAGGPIDPSSYYYPASAGVPGAFSIPAPPPSAMGGGGGRSSAAAAAAAASMHHHHHQQQQHHQHHNQSAAAAQHHHHHHTGAGAQAYSPVAAVVGGGGSAAVCYTEVVHIWVPNNVVGALIGTKGVHIRNIMRLTGAHVRIESSKAEGGGTSGNDEQPQPQQPQSEESHGEEMVAVAAATGSMAVSQPEQAGQGSGGRPPDTERRVTITGSDQQQYKAQYWLFQRLSEHGHYFFDEVRLCTEIQVPSKLVGRIIGKGGQNVRELQRVTGAQVKIPEDAATQDENEDTLVRIIGNFNSSQAVQARIRQLVHQFHGQQQQLQQQPRSLSADRQRSNSGRGAGLNHYGDGHE